METGTVWVTNLTKARRTKRRYDAVITIEDPGQRNPLRFHVSPHPEHLVMKFEDVDFHDSTIALPRQEHVTAAIEFGRRHPGGNLLVHCRAGIARSTALALAIIADRLGAGHEKEAVAELLRVRPEAAPNLLILPMADALLERDGALVDAWMAVENSSAEYAEHREKKVDLFREKPHLFARATASITGTIQFFPEKAITPRFGLPAK
jgi:predicted protein tyrosine phosphatase